jgi:DNA-binding IclR family transcriptional regulator
MMEDNEKNRRIQSVEIGFAILRAFAEKKMALNLSEIAHETKLHKSQIYRYLNSFVHLGVLIRENEENPKWQLGPELISLGNAAFDGLDIAKQATPHLIELRNELNETVGLSIWRDRGPFFVHWEKSNKLISIGIDTRSYVPLYTATGKIFRAFLSEETTKQLYQKEVLAGNIIPEKYDQDIERVRKSGLSVTESSLISGVAVISSPIFYSESKLAGALSVLGIHGMHDISPNSLSARKLQEKCDIISTQLGFNGPLKFNGLKTL